MSRNYTGEFTDGEEGVPEMETFTKYSKYAIKEFSHSLDKISEETGKRDKGEGLCGSSNPHEGIRHEQDGREGLQIHKG